ncbi:hypothetical protein P7C73_g4093, partial [Tremellales sp. Uapishka_1]
MTTEENSLKAVQVKLVLLDVAAGYGQLGYALTLTFFILSPPMHLRVSPPRSVLIPSRDPSLSSTCISTNPTGEAAVGKSSLVLRFVSNDFNENNSPTIGAAFLTQKCRLENRIVKFEIWDTAGQGVLPSIKDKGRRQLMLGLPAERFHSLAPMYYRNAAAAVVVYDITKAASLEKAKAWVKELQRQANPNIVIALVGNKLDLVAEPSTVTEPIETPETDGETEEDDESTPSPPAATPTSSDDLRQVSTAEAEAYAKECNLLFFEASAKTGLNVGEVFTEIAKTIPLDTAGPKPPAATAAGRRSAANGSTEPGRVALDGEVAKKGGCC